MVWLSYRDLETAIEVKYQTLKSVMLNAVCSVIWPLYRRDDKSSRKNNGDFFVNTCIDIIFLQQNSIIISHDGHKNIKAQLIN